MAPAAGVMDERNTGYFFLQTMNPTPTPTVEQRPTPKLLAFIISVKGWNEVRNLIFATSQESAIWRSNKASEDAGYKLCREDFVASRADLYDRFAEDFPRENGYDMSYVEGRIIGLLEKAERRNAELAKALEAMNVRMTWAVNRFENYITRPQKDEILNEIGTATAALAGVKEGKCETPWVDAHESDASQWGQEGKNMAVSSEVARALELRATFAERRCGELELAVKSAVRLLDNSHTKWSSAGGVNECAHGYSEGIPCPKCDEALVRTAALTPKPEPKGETK